MKKVLVIIPTYNEAENITPIILAVLSIQKQLRNSVLHILVVDDESPDGTGKIVKKLMKEHHEIRMITGSKSGLGKAYIRGFSYGLSQHLYDAFVMMDADFSHDPKSIPSLLRAIDNGSDYVIGSRYTLGGAIPGNWPLLRIINSRFANFIARTLIGVDKGISDLTGGFKAIKASALEQIDLTSLHAAGYFFQVNLLHAFIQNGFQISESPIVFADRQFGVSKLKLTDILEFIYRAYMLNPNSHIRTFVRFIIVGMLGTVVNVLVLSLILHLTSVVPVIADAVAIEISILSNFIFNQLYTFRLEGPKEATYGLMIHKLIRFNLAMLGGAFISFVVFTGLYEFFHVFYLIADVFGILIAMSWNYWSSTRLVWRHEDARA